MFRSSDSETESLALNYEWSLRTAPPRHVIHVCGPAYSSTCVVGDEDSGRIARCERCGAQISFTALARMIRRAEEQQL
jgi:hypothetical protein